MILPLATLQRLVNALRKAEERFLIKKSTEKLNGKTEEKSIGSTSYAELLSDAKSQTDLVPSSNITTVGDEINTGAVGCYFEMIQEKIESIDNKRRDPQVSKLKASFSFVKNAMDHLKMVFEDCKEQIDTTQLESSLSLIHEAKENALDVFRDKSNASRPIRELAMYLVWFCDAMECYDAPHKLLCLWNANIKEFFDDNEICKFYKNALEICSEWHQETSIINLQNTFTLLLAMLENTLESSTQMREAWDRILQLVYHPKFVTSSSKFLLTWLNADVTLILPKLAAIPVHRVKNTLAVCALPNHSYAALFVQNRRLFLKTLNAWTHSVFTTLEMPFESYEAENKSWNIRRIQYLPDFNLILLCDCETGKITYYNFDKQNNEININHNVPRTLPTSLPSRFAHANELSSCRIFIDRLNGKIVCCELNVTRPETRNYIWRENEWRKMDGFPLNHYITSITTSKEIDSYVKAISSECTTSEKFFVTFDLNGVFISKENSWIRRETVNPFYGNYSTIFALTEEKNHNGDVFRVELEMYDVYQGKLITHEILPRGKYTDICQVGDRLVLSYV